MANKKTVTVELIGRKQNGRIAAPYKIMEDLVAKHHSHLADAKIAMAWRFGKGPDPDGRLWLGQAKKGSDLDRALHGFDFVILLNHEIWNSAEFAEEHMIALIDHELCHCERAVDADGIPKIDELDRPVYRIRKHDVEEFIDVVNRHGIWKDDIRKLAEAAQEAKDRPLLPFGNE